MCAQDANNQLKNAGPLPVISTASTSSPPEGGWADESITRQTQDRFGFRAYATVLADQALQADTPVVIGIYGRWGSGKTSLMRLIQDHILKTKALHPPGARRNTPHKDSLARTSVIWLDVWQFSNQAEVWQAFLQALFTQVNKSLSLWQRLDKKKLARMLVINSYRVVLAITPVILGVMIGDPEAGWQDVLTILFKPFSGDTAAATAGALATWLMALWAIVRPAVGAAREVINIDLQKTLKYPAFDVQVSELMRLQKSFSGMVKTLVGDDGRLVVFIDDLDRCAPDKIAEMLEAIKLFAATPRCAYILGMDYEIVRQGVKVRYKFEIEAAATDYLEKIVQIPFHLPPLDAGRIYNFVRDDYPEVMQECPTAAEVFSFGMEPNPRKVKRALNIYRTLLRLAEVRYAAWEIDRLDPELVAKMVVLQDRFRRLYEHILNEPGFLAKVEDYVSSFARISAPTLAKGDVVGEILLGKGSQAGLIDAGSLRSLHDLLTAGKQHFKDPDQKDNIPSYIYLIATTEGGGVHVRPTSQERQVLLSVNYEKVEELVKQILMRAGDDPLQREQIRQAYLERLEIVLHRPDLYSAIERSMAVYAMYQFERWDERVAEFFASGDPVQKLAAILSRCSGDVLPGMRFLMDSYVMDILHTRRDQVLKQAEINVTVELLFLARDRLSGWHRAGFEPLTVLVEVPEYRTDTEYDESGAHVTEVKLPVKQPLKFRIGRYTVTNAEYKAFLVATGHTPPPYWNGVDFPSGKEQHPVAQVSLQDARAYCAWLSQQTGRTYRLPTSEEWEWAAKGIKDDTWRDIYTTKSFNSKETGIADTTPVGNYSPGGDSPFGCADMLGNVWEWCDSAEGPALRGGAFDSAGEDVTSGMIFAPVVGETSAAKFFQVDTPTPLPQPFPLHQNVGFRVALSAT